MDAKIERVPAFYPTCGFGCESYAVRFKRTDITDDGTSVDGDVWFDNKGEPCLRHLWEIAVAASFPT